MIRMMCEIRIFGNDGCLPKSLLSLTSQSLLFFSAPLFFEMSKINIFGFYVGFYLETGNNKTGKKPEPK